MFRSIGRRTSDQGAAAIELALVMPLFVGVIVGLVTTALVFFANLQLATAAEEGARVMYLGGTVSQARTATTTAAASNASVINLNTGAPLPDAWSCATPGNSGVTVAVRALRPNMTIQWLLASTTVTARGRGVTRCP